MEIIWRVKVSLDNSWIMIDGFHMDGQKISTPKALK